MAVEGERYCGFCCARAASLSVAPQAGPKISPLRTPPGRRERRPGRPRCPPFRWFKKTAFARRRAALLSGHNASQSTTARRRALLQSAATPARAQQHGGVRFYRAPRQPEHNSTAACASAERHASQSTTARRRALLQSFCPSSPSHLGAQVQVRALWTQLMQPP